MAGPNRRNIVQRSLWTGSNRDCGKCCMTRVSLRMPSVRRRSVAKTFDITLLDFKQIDEILKRMDTKGIHTMRIGELENKDMLSYHQKGKIAALKAAQRKASYLVEALGKKLGPVIRIVEDEAGSSLPFSQSNVLSSNVVSFDSFRTIKKKYSMLVRFEIAD